MKFANWKTVVIVGIAMCLVATMVISANAMGHNGTILSLGIGAVLALAGISGFEVIKTVRNKKK